MENFGKHEDLSVEFSDTLTVLKGPNGAGKSTLLQAVYFALFGVSAVDGTSKDIPRHGETDCKVTLFVEFGEKSCSITRTLKTAAVHLESALAATGHTAVNEWVQQQLGVSQRSFLALTYSPQTETAAIMSVGAAALDRMVEQISGAEFIEQVEKKSAELKAAETAKLSALGEVKNIADLEKRMSDLRASLVDADSRVTTLTEIMAAAEEAKAEASEQLSKASALDKARAVLLRDIAVYESKLPAARKELQEVSDAVAGLGNAEAKVAELTLAKEALAAEESQWAAKERESDRYHQRLAHLERWLAGNQVNLVEERARLLPAVDEADASLSAARDYAEACLAAVVEAKRLRSQALQAMNEGACPECRRPFDDVNEAELRNNYIEACEKLALAEKVAEEASNTVKEWQAHRNALALPSEREAAQWSEQFEELRALRNNPVTLDAAGLSDYKALYREALVNLNNAERDMQALQALRMKEDSLSASIVKDEQGLHNAKTQLASHPEVDVEAASRALSAASDKWSEVKDARAVAVQEAHAARLSVEVLEKELASARELAEKRRLSEKREAEFDGLTKFLRSNRAEFMADLWDQLMALTSQFVAQVTDGRIEAIARQNGQFLYREGERWLPYARLAGGFKAIAGVGLRLALASLLPAGVSCILLDEPSSELAEDLAAALAGALRGQDRQIIMVTHRMGEEYTADSVVEL